MGTKTLKRTLRQQINRVEKWYSLADDETIQAGKVWYSNAHNWAEDVAASFTGGECEATISVYKVATITAILSAQCDWDTNKANVIKFIANPRDPQGMFATQKQLDECRAVISEGWTIPEHRRKTYTFATTIANPDIDHCAVIDRHAIKVAFDQTSSAPICITDKRYSDAEKAFIVAADRHNLLASQVQAITWCAYKQHTGR